MMLFKVIPSFLILLLALQMLRALSYISEATMFWKFDLHTTSHIDQLLDKEDVTLRELMEEDDVLQECKAQNRRLLFFLSQDHCMQELVNLITTEPPTDIEERSRFKWVFSVTEKPFSDSLKSGISEMLSPVLDCASLKVSERCLWAPDIRCGNYKW